MNNVFLIDELDAAIDQMVAGGPAPEVSAELTGLLEIADSLRALPRPDFKLQLGRELEWEASGRLVSNGKRASRPAVPKPAALTAIFGDGYGIYPVRRTNFIASLTLHAAMIALVGFGFLAVKNNRQVEGRRVIVDVMPITLPPGTPHGGGSGGGHDQTPESKGMPARAADLQLVPPTVYEPPKETKLPASPTIVAPEMNLPNAQVGDQLSTLTRLSDGTGLKAGIGPGNDRGEGSGSGNGYGPGSGGSLGGGAYRVGKGGATAPRAIYTPEPEFSEEARKIKHTGIVVLRAVIDVDGHPKNLRVERSLGYGLDEKAIETVAKWRFEPGKMNGRPVAVEMNIIVDYNIF